MHHIYIYTHYVLLKTTSERMLFCSYSKNKIQSDYTLTNGTFTRGVSVNASHLLWMGDVTRCWIVDHCHCSHQKLNISQLFTCVSQSDRSMQITDNATQLRLCKTWEQRSMSLQTRLSSSVNASAPCLCTVMFMVRSVIFRTHVGLNLPLWIFLMWRIMWIQIFAMGKEKRYWSSNVCFPCMANSGYRTLYLRSLDRKMSMMFSGGRRFPSRGSLLRCYCTFL